MMSAVRICLLVLVLGAGGCAALRPEPPDEAAAIRPPHKPVPPRPSTFMPVPERKPAEAAARQPEKPAGPAEAAAAMAPVVMAPVASAPVALPGLAEAEARRLLGPPATVTERPPALVWAYESAGCRLELSLYLDVASRSFRVLTYETTPKGRDGLAGDACVGSIRAAAPRAAAP